MTEKTVLCQEQSLLCENGKNERKPQELTAKQCKEGFSKTRDPQHPGATTSILADRYDQDPAYASKLVIFSTLVSIPTTALWCWLLQAA